MSLVVCARPGCDLAAATSLLVDGRHVAAVCSERCGYELIGPKRSADDMSDAAAGGDDKRQDVVYRELDKKRYLDLSGIALFIFDICNRHKAFPAEPNTNHIATLARMRLVLHQIINRKQYKVFDLHYWRKQADIDYEAIPSITSDESERLGDMAKMSSLLQQLADLAHRLDELTPLGVAGATLQIGRRLDRSGSDLKRRIDEAIAVAVATIDQIAENEPYDMNSVEVLLSKLRNDIAADDSLDEFDRTDAGRAAKYVGLPDDVRLLIQLRSSPVEVVGAIPMRKKITWMCVTEHGYMSYNDGSLYPDYVKIGINSDRAKHLDAVRSRNKYEGAAFGPNSVREHRGAHIGPTWGTAPVTIVNPRALILATGSYEAAVFLDFPFADNTLYPNSVVCKLRKASIADIKLVAQYTVHYNTFTFRPSHMAIDANGFLWCICTQADNTNRIIVVDARGRILDDVSFRDNTIDCICAGVEGVWIAVSFNSKHEIKHLRLAPTYNYSVGM
jgi:hypothetical protein